MKKLQRMIKKVKAGNIAFTLAIGWLIFSWMVQVDRKRTKEAIPEDPFAHCMEFYFEGNYNDSTCKLCLEIVPHGVGTLLPIDLWERLVHYQKSEEQVKYREILAEKRRIRMKSTL